ncbi:hypothetical protein [Marinoscillum furvescens]|uniref:Uncharacterized protein n=1 Tax=Marinoscillum furvescens DSM 4134 TaxID=1122208 RepID=A0A3D9L7I9_MARFU|nr:hypothetical protein [Marinoscillum furvescens]REE01081.1 hypothetical protein C7460_104101 [Marinoscillum furvescens DSM 4134]
MSTLKVQGQLRSLMDSLVEEEKRLNKQRLEAEKIARSMGLQIDWYSGKLSKRD